MEFPIPEYEARLSEVHRRMEAQGIDVLFLTGEKNIRYLSGYHNQGWISPTRARYLVVRNGEAPVAVLPSTNVVGFGRLSWVTEVLHWPAPRPDDEGISLLVEAATKGGSRPARRIAIECGPESRWQAPLVDLWAVQRRFGNAEWVDGQPVMRGARARKSPREIAIMRQLADIVSSVLDDKEALAGLASERDVYFSLFERLVGRRIEQVPYLVVTSGVGGYEQINTGPLDNSIVCGTTLCVDTGCSQAGYFCDITRNYQFQEPDSHIDSEYRRLHRATDAGLAATRPGVRAKAVWASMAEEIGQGASATPVGRMGHGIGLDITEGLSISATDETVLESGMTLTLEPSLLFRSGDTRRIMVHEENVVVTDTGVELLSRRAPPTIHHVPASCEAVR